MWHMSTFVKLLTKSSRFILQQCEEKGTDVVYNALFIIVLHISRGSVVRDYMPGKKLNS